jgi:PPOX class probable F420-dependent enzyme
MGAPERRARLAAMSPAEAEFLRDHLWALLATSRRDGAPQVSMVAYDFDGADLVVSCHRGSAKAVNARTRPAVVLTVADDRRYLAVQGMADVLVTGEERDQLTRRVQEALGPDDAAILERAFARGLDQAGRVIIRIRPERILGRLE